MRWRSRPGSADGEAWWSRLIEERHAEDDPTGLFDAIHGAMASAREELGSRPHARARAHDTEEPAREAHMRKAIRAALKEGFERIVVVCGAWHAPVLTADALKRYPAKQDDELLKGLPKRKTAATWIPWTYDRLCFDSGYGAGVASPGWYDHLWVHREQLSARWMIRVARLLRDEDIDASPANVIESVRLADSLAAIRGRQAAGLDELDEATLSVLCHGNPVPVRLIQRKLVVGQRLGQVPDAVPMVPLQRDLTALQKSLRLKVSADRDDPRPRSAQRQRPGAQPPAASPAHARHRLGRAAAGSAAAGQHVPRDLDAAMAAGVRRQGHRGGALGNTVADAAAASVTHRAESASDLAELTALLDDVMLADLPARWSALLARIQSMSAVSTDLGHLMTALPPLARVLRYGNVRKTDAALVEPVVAGLLARISVGLLPACASLDDDAAELMRRRIDGVDGVLATLNRPDWAAVWRDALAKVADADIHGLVAGRAYRLLLDAGSRRA